MTKITCASCGCPDINWSPEIEELYGGIAYCPLCGEELPYQSSKIEFQDYESVRVSGVTNMFDRRTVQELSGLDQATITEIMSHYKDLIERT